MNNKIKVSELPLAIQGEAWIMVSEEVNGQLISVKKKVYVNSDKTIVLRES